ncbi:MAG: DUF4442 domain-containing protein [Bacteroidia bacterium]|nr:DUF4442 domain-containing protein [Bacteroidia bacterium]
MNFHEIPFGKHLQIKDAQAPFLVELADNSIYENHLGTVAAAALFSLAEFAAGKLLMQSFPEWVDKVIPVLRKADVRFKKPGKGKVRAKAELLNQDATEILNQLKNQGRVLVDVQVAVLDEQDIILMTGTYEWFLALKA